MANIIPMRLFLTKETLSADPGAYSQIFVSIKEMQSITIVNTNHAFLDANVYTLSYHPDIDVCYENYQIYLGTSPENVSLYTQTTNRTIQLINLEYGTTYYCDIYAVNDNNQQLLSTKASTIFTTAPQPIPLPPSYLDATAYTSGIIGLQWSDNSQYESGFVLERKLAGDDHFTQIHMGEISSYTDTQIHGNQTYIYRVSAINSTGMSTFSNEITVTTYNSAPLIISSPPNQIEQNSLYTYSIMTENLDNDILSFSAIKKPADMIIHPKLGKILWTPMNSDVGQHDISIKVSDGTFETTQDFTLEVLNINDAPVASNLTFTCYEDSVLHSLLTGQDIDNYTLTYQILTQPLNGQLAINGDMITYTPTSNYFGNEHLTYQINDGQLYSEIADLILVVLPLNDPPFVEHELSDIFVDENGSITPVELTHVFSDIDNSYTELTWNVTGQSALSITILNNIATIVISDDHWNGTETIIFSATDPNGLSTSESVTISGIPYQPVFSGLPFVIRIQKPDSDWNGFVTVAFSATDTNKYTDYGSKSFTVNNMMDYTSINLDTMMSDFDIAYSDVTWTTVGQNQLTVTIDSKNVVNIRIPDSVWSGSETITFTTSDTHRLTGLDYEKINVNPVDDILEDSDLTLIIQILKLIEQ